MPSTSTEPDSPVKDILSLITTAQTTVPTVSKQRNSSPSKGTGSMLAKMLTGHRAKHKDKSKPNENVSERMPKAPQAQGRKRENLETSPTKTTVTKQRKTEATPKPHSQVQIAVHTVAQSVSSTQPQIASNAAASLQVVTLSGGGIGQLSPSLESRLQQSTGVIENLDGFCAVADIVEEDEDEEGEIDIENEDEENPILKSRSASPNSVYEQLIRAANLGKSPEKVRHKEVIDEPEKPPETKPCQSEALSTKTDGEKVKVTENVEDVPVSEEFLKPKSSK